MSDELNAILERARLDALLNDSRKAMIELETAIVKSGEGAVFMEMDLRQQLKFTETALSRAILANDWVAAGMAVLMLRGIRHLHTKESGK